MSPATAPVDEHDRKLRTPDDRLTGKPETQGLPDEEGVEEADVDNALDEETHGVRNRRDVPPTPENSIEERTDGSREEITGI
jgi:hypothetical protein